MWSAVFRLANGRVEPFGEIFVDVLRNVCPRLDASCVPLLS